MPTVSINLSERAYAIYIQYEKGHRSQRVSAAIMQWNALKGVKWEVID